MKVYLLRGFVHTPLYVLHYCFPLFQVLNFVYSVPFSVGTLGAACGVMITGMQVTLDTAHVPDSLLDLTSSEP